MVQAYLVLANSQRDNVCFPPRSGHLFLLSYTAQIWLILGDEIHRTRQPLAGPPNLPQKPQGDTLPRGDAILLRRRSTLDGPS
jgi:hypothetical protein